MSLLCVCAFTVLLSACAQTGVKPTTLSGKVMTLDDDNASDDGDELVATSAPVTPDALPAIPLTPEILYQLTISEIAAQRGLTGAAAATDFDLARRTRDPRIARRATEFALIDRQPAAALQAAQQWLELAPHSPEARDTVLTLLAATNRLDEAEPILRNVLSTSNSRLQGIMQVHGLLARSPNRAAAFAMFDRLAAGFTDLPEVRLALSQFALIAGDKKRAVAEARAGLAMKPDWEPAVLMLAQSLQADGDARGCVDVLNDYLKRNPKSLDTRMALARVLVSDRRFADATAQFEILLREAPDNLDTLYALGVLSLQAGQSEKLDAKTDAKANEKANVRAEMFFKRFLDARARLGNVNNDTGRGPNPVYLYLAQIAEDRKDFQAALDYLADITAGEEFMTARARRAVLLARMGRLDEARKDLHDTVAHSERERIQLIQTEAQLLREGGRGQESFDVLAAALAKAPANADLLYDYAMAAENIGRLDVMETTLKSLMRLQPEAAQAYNALGYTLADRNIRLDEARTLIEKALSLAPDDAAILDSMGWVQYRLGDNARAIDFLRRAYGLRPDAEVASHLGEVLWVSGQHAEAEKLWRDAAGKDPANEVLRNTLARFHVSVGAR